MEEPIIPPKTPDVWVQGLALFEASCDVKEYEFIGTCIAIGLAQFYLFNVSPADIRGTKRNANVASARRVAIYILREVTGMSMEEIGREFSGRDHSTIVYSLKTMERDMKNDQHLRETVSDIIKNVKA